MAMFPEFPGGTIAWNLPVTSISNRTVRDSASHAIAYHRMDVLPEAKLCYHTDTLSYAGNPWTNFWRWHPKTDLNGHFYCHLKPTLNEVSTYSDIPTNVVTFYLQIARWWNSAPNHFLTHHCTWKKKKARALFDVIESRWVKNSTTSS